MAAIRRKDSIMRTILLALLLMSNQAGATEYNFYVAHISDMEIEARAFNCETKNDELSCNIRQTSVSHFEWKDAKDAEPKRCQVSAWNGKDTYKMKSMGVWAKQERGSSCNVLIEYVIKPASNGQVEYEQITLENKDDDSYCVGVFGKTGTIRHYNHYDFLTRIPMACSSIVISP
jgi:hypothetical protein